MVSKKKSPQRKRSPCKPHQCRKRTSPRRCVNRDGPNRTDCSPSMQRPRLPSPRKSPRKSVKRSAGKGMLKPCPEGQCRAFGSPRRCIKRVGSNSGRKCMDELVNPTLLSDARKKLQGFIGPQPLPQEEVMRRNAEQRDNQIREQILGRNRQINLF